MASVNFLLLVMALLPLNIVCRQLYTGINTTHTSHQESLTEYWLKCDEDFKRRSATCKYLKLKQVPDYLSPDIRILSLSRNLIHTLYNSSFWKYPQLMDLDLVENKIRIIESAAFLPLKHLQHLDMSKNHDLGHFNPIIFKWSHSLSFLLMTECGFTSFPESKSQQQFMQMRRLDLGNNQISHINITCTSDNSTKFQISIADNDFRQLTPETFELDCDVDVLDLHGLNVTRIVPDTIAALRVHTMSVGGHALTSEVWNDMLIGIARSHIKGLSIGKDTLPDILTPNFFSPLYNYPISLLELTRVRLNYHNITLFSNLNLLLKLTIHEDFIHVLEPKLFLGMIELQILHLERNSISEINPHYSMWSTLNLREIYLSYNDLSEVRENTFQGLKNVSRLDLAHNAKLKYLNIDALCALHNLQYLDVSSTSLMMVYLNTPVIRSISSTSLKGSYILAGITFTHTPSLKSLDLSDSNLKLEKLWVAEKNQSLFDDLNNLTHLLLRHNPLKILVSGMFRQLTALEFLDLSNCEISKVQSKVFLGLSSLHTLSLQENKIQRLPGRLLTDLKALLTYNLTANYLYYLDSRTFTATTSLKTLLLAANKFPDFNQSTFEPIMFTLISIDISQNSLLCDCKIAWLVKWLDGQVKVLNDNDTVCSTASATLGPLRGKPLLTFIPNDFCGTNIALISLILLAFVTFFVTLYLVYYYRWFLRYKLYLLKLAVIGYEEVLDAREHGDFEFDINIMFIEDDMQWVQEHLRPVLEERLPNFNRNAIGDDGLILGMHYLDAVYYVIEKSFKTVLLLSRAAFQDNWFMIRFRIAFEQVNDARLENVVVVFLEDIPDAELPFLVRLYLSERRTYLWWVEDERGQEYFWNELILTLQRDNMRWNIMIPPE